MSALRQGNENSGPRHEKKQKKKNMVNMEVNNVHTSVNKTRHRWKKYWRRLEHLLHVPGLTGKIGEPAAWTHVCRLGWRSPQSKHSLAQTLARCFASHLRPMTLKPFSYGIQMALRAIARVEWGLPRHRSTFAPSRAKLLSPHQPSTMSSASMICSSCTGIASRVRQIS